MPDADAPMLVLVHGPPGSGKSTLARSLGRELRLPVFEKDVFKDVVFDTLGSSDREWSKRVGALSGELLSTCVAQLVTNGSSVIAESNFRPTDELVVRFRELRSTSPHRCVEIYCFAEPEMLWQRFDARRNSGERHAGHVGFGDRTTFLDDLVTRPHGPLGLGDELFEVDTTETFPSAEAVAEWIRTRA